MIIDRLLPDANPACKFQAALAFSNLCILCGDENSKALERTKSNIDGSATKARINPVQWVAVNLPFKDSFVDVIVTDMV